MSWGHTDRDVQFQKYHEYLDLLQFLEDFYMPDEIDDMFAKFYKWQELGYPSRANTLYKELSKQLHTKPSCGG